jgi:hypothetical protein
MADKSGFVKAGSMFVIGVDWKQMPGLRLALAWRHASAKRKPGISNRQ